MLNERLRTVRNQKKLSQREFAEILGIGLKSWQQYESGVNIPGGKVLEALLTKCNINVNWLLTGMGQMYYREGDVGYDRELLVRIVAVLESYLTQKNIIFDSDRKGKVIAKLFENLSKVGVQADNIATIEKETLELLELI